MALQMFLSMIRVPQTCFEIALTWSSSKGQTLHTRRDSSLNEGEGEVVADEFSDSSLRFPKDGFPQLGEQGDTICQINDIMRYARGKHTQLNIG